MSTVSPQKNYLQVSHHHSIYLWGNRHWELGRYVWDTYGVITPSNIEELWGTELQPDGDRYVWAPYDCIAIAYADYSWGPYTTSNPDMGDAFVDYGADSFVGSITSITKSSSGECSLAFWDALSIDNDDVEQGTRDLCTEGSWTYNTHWKILGSTSKTLP